MKSFMDENFLLKNEAAVRLFHDYAKKMPIFDYHCHINVNEICEDKRYENLTQVWLYGDHYKWRAMRLNGVEERLITGDASDYDKFLAYAKTLGNAIGNPLYHWTHLELQRFFGIYEPLNEKTAPSIWEKANKVLTDGLTTRKMILDSGVKALCSTDDPTDDLRYHRELREKGDFPVNVMPTYRPDNAVEIGAPGFLPYMEKLAGVSGVKIDGVADLLAALRLRLDYFEESGCRLSDHGLATAPFAPVTEAEADKIYKKVAAGGQISAYEEEQFKTYIIRELAKEYYNRGMIMQLHMGPMRRVNSAMTRKLGADCGFDSIGDRRVAESLGSLLNSINETGIPKTVLYNLNPKDNAVLSSMLGNFADGGVPGKIQFGSGWWFNDTKDGMEEQMKVLANHGLLSQFVGMLTDSRSFTSYPRFEYFRRILCNIIGTWMEDGEIAWDMERMGGIVEDICYNNIVRYFEK